MILKTPRTQLKILSPEDAPYIAKYFTDNKQYFIDSMPVQKDEFYTPEFWEKNLPAFEQHFKDDKHYRFFMTEPDKKEIIGAVNFTQIQRGGYQGCFLGYAIDEKHAGKGLVTEACAEGIRYMFEEQNLHKINANFLPENIASGKILEKLGFEKIGLAKEELYLNNKWRDHIMMRLTNPNWKKPD